MRLVNKARRAFLKRAPLAAAAVSLTASDPASLAGIETARGVMSARDPLLFSDGESAIKLLGVLKLTGIPEWKKQEWNYAANFSRVLDPDIAVLRSVSLVAKWHMQKKRNEQRLPRALFDDLTRRASRAAFNKAHGISGNWW